MAKKIELLHTTYDKSGNIESQEVVHPLTSPDCIIMENGKTLDEVMGDGIATPTLTHEGTSFKVGVGDSNIEVVDGDVAGMTLKGQSYQNILPKPTTLIMETDEKEFKINDKIDSNIIIDDNIAEIATVKGKTIVNAVQEESGSEYTVLGEDLSGQGEIVTENTVDGNLKGVTLQGQTLVNTIQEPCKDDYVVLGDSIEISAETGGHGTIEDAVGGSIKSAILKGQTLVNLLPNKGKQRVSVSGNRIVKYPLPHTLKKNTKYLVYYNVEDISNPSGSNSLQITMYSEDVNVVDFIDSIDKTGLRKHIFTTSDKDFEQPSVWFFIFSSETTEAIFDEVMIIEYQEGMENWDIPYFEGMQSVKMPVLTTTGKNLWNFESSIRAGVISFTDVDLELGTYYFSLDVDKTFTTSPVVAFVTSTDEVVAYGYADRVNKYEITKDVSYITLYSNGFSYNNSHGNITTFSNMFLTKEEHIKSEYEPYKSNILTTNEEVELRKVGDVQDELNLLTGELTQRFEQFELNSAKYFANNTYTDLGNTIRWQTTNDFRTVTTLKTQGQVMSNTFVSDSSHDDYEHIRLDGSSPNANLILYLNKTKATTYEELNTYLKNNPLIIIGEKANESVKTVDLTVLDQDGNTIPHIQTQPTVTHITASSDYLIPTVTIDNNLAYDTIIKPSTLYTVRFKHNTVNADNPLTVDLGGTVQEVTSTEFTITTPSTLTHNQLVFSGKNNVVSEVQVIEGDVTGIEYPFFEGMNDVKFSDSKIVGRGKNLVRHLSASSYYGFTIQEAQGSSTIINGSLTTDYRDYYIVGTNENTHLIDYFNKMKVGETIHFSSNITGFAHHIAIGKSQQSNTYYCVDKYTKQSQDDVLLSMFIRFTKDCSFNNNELQIQIEIGSTATSYEPYKGVEVQQDVDSIPLTSDMFEQGARERGMGFSIQQCPLSSNAARISSKTLIPVKPSSNYTVTGINTSINHIWGDMYDKDGLVCYDSVLDLTGGISSGTGVFVPHDVHYLCIKVKNADESAITPSALDSMNLILQEVPQEIVLRGIGDVKDTLDLTRGVYIQRIVEATFDGSSDENWVIVTSTTSVNEVTTLIGIYGLNDAKPENTNESTAVANNMVANNYAIKNIFGAKHTTEGCTLHVDNSLNRGHLMVRTKMLLTNAQQWEDYLQTNPLVVQYELKTPIIHKVNLTNTKVIQSYATETHYETITPSDSLIPNITIPSTLNYNVAIKPSTQYTIRANTSDNLTVDLGGATGTLSNGKVTLTTPATLTHNEVKFSGTGKVKELMVVEGNEIKDNVPFFNGMKDVQMGGIKLVNIARGAVYNENVLTANANKTQFTYTSDGSHWGVIRFDDTLLKPNSVYTLCMNIVSNDLDADPSIKVCYGVEVGNGYTTFAQNKTGIQKIKINTIDNPANNALYIGLKPCTSGKQVVIENPMVIEGDWTHLDEIPYIESEMIIDQPIIRSQGKNLLDLESKPFTIASAGTTFAKSGNTYTVTTTLANSTPYDYIRRVWTVNDDKWLRDVRGKELTLSVSSISCSNSNSLGCIQFRIECEDGSKTYPGIHASLGQTTDTFIMPTNAKNLQMQIMTNNTGAVLTEDTTLTVSNIQLELGNTATQYEPYKHQTLYSNRVIGYEENCYYIYDSGTRAVHGDMHTIIADVEGLSIAYVTCGSSNFSFWDKDGIYISGKQFLDSTLSKFDANGFITVPSNAKYIKYPSSIVYENKPYYTKATVTGELPLRSLPNGVCDTLNLVTGEYVQRVGEVVFDGSEDEGWHMEDVNIVNHLCFDTVYAGVLETNPLYTNFRISDKFDSISHEEYLSDSVEGIRYFSIPAISISRSKLSEPNVTGFKQYLSQNPITAQYELATPIVRKLGFTTKGNYRQANLATDCEWGASPTTANNTFTTRYRTKSASSLPIVYNTHLFSNDFTVRYFNVDAHQDYEYISNMEYGQYVNVRRDKLEADTVEAFNKWLQHNPIEVGYITNQQSSESYSNIHKPIFFNNVNVQFLPHNLDIQPQLTFQARTRNSYVMDMMKPNTTYTMKCLAYSNSAKLYVANSSANTSVSSNKTLQFAQSHLDGSKNGLVLVGQWYEPMIIEGDVTAKNLPYFKGILSSYHDVDEVELYSVNKNLFDMSKVEPYNESGAHWWNTTIKENEVVSVRSGNIEAGQFGAYATLDVRPNSTYTLYIEMEKDGEPYNGQIYGYENDKVWGNGTFTGYANTPYHIKTSHNAKYITIGFNYGKDFPIGTKLVAKNMRLYLGEESPVYIPHAHSTTLIEMPTRLETVKVVRPIMENGAINTGTGVSYDDGDALVRNVRTKDYLPVQPGEIIKFYNNGQGRAVNIHYYDIDKQFIKYEFYDGTSTRPTVPKDCHFARMYCGKSACSDITLTRQAYKPIQLNSLPNGVYDEIIMKPNSNKAQLVQRVGKVVLDGSGDYHPSNDKHNIISFMEINALNLSLAKGTTGLIPDRAYCDKLLIGNPYFKEEQGIPSDKSCVGVYLDFVRLCLHELDENEHVYRNYLQQNPITVYYELATPIIHEIQLKGYAHVYENGTVTLNTDIPHLTLISYNVNQEQLINTQNEIIIRHDQQIDDLYYYIEMYLEEIYQMELFRMKLELSL